MKPVVDMKPEDVAFYVKVQRLRKEADANKVKAFYEFVKTHFDSDPLEMSFMDRTRAKYLFWESRIASKVREKPENGE